MIGEKTAATLILLLVASIILLVAGEWQIEAIWWCQNNGEMYQLPFNSHRSLDLWYWHDIWFVDIVISWVIIAVPYVVLVIKCLTMSKELVRLRAEAQKRG